jgi:hypothetical protein
VKSNCAFIAAHCHLGLGRLAGQTGDPEKARKHLTMAAAMYRGMDMGFWLEKAEAVLKDTSRHGS